jgi:hypothetical protein
MEFTALWHYPLGTVIEDRNATVWEKRGQNCWMHVGSSSEYESTSILWPIHVWREGIG